MTLIRHVAMLTMLIGPIGCSPLDQRLVDFAAEANQQQTRQSEQVANQSQQIAATARGLVEQDAAARRELLAAQERTLGELREQQVQLDRQREQLHAERREAAETAARAPVIAQAVITLAMVLAALLPFLVTAYALRRLPETGATEQLLAEALLEDLATIPSATSVVPSPGPLLADSAPPGLPPVQR